MLVATEVGAGAGAESILADTHVVIEEVIETTTTIGLAVPALARVLPVIIAPTIHVAIATTTAATDGLATVIAARVARHPVLAMPLRPR